MLNPGAKLGHYEIVEAIGAGGMGEVFRAADTRLGREVALKVLPDLFARDPDRLARFQREAHLLASLNHPHIAAIHGLEEAAGVRFLVLELVEGETLAERLKRGAVPLEEALKTCRQIADALEAAHEKGIIHRDLKPGNVKLTPDATVKVLDFGLAKAFEGELPPAEVSKSPTLSAVATQAGILLGTAAYMSPEQAKGRPVDKRGDLWAFGCVLYELLTGKQVFEGETISETLASVLKTEPDWKALPADTPAAIARLLRRCLERDPRRRLQAIGEARILLDDFLAGKLEEAVAAPGPAAAPQPGWRRALPWAALLAVALGLALWRPWQPQPAPPAPVRLNVALATTDPLYTEVGPAIVLSPDGRRLAYVTRSGPNNRLYLREMDKLEATALSGTEGAFNPFFSPDGQWIGFFANGKMKKVSVTGGAPLTLCDAADGRGGSWGLDDSIIFSPNTDSPLFKVSAAGGAPAQLTQFDKKKDVVGEISHRWPQILPGGRAVLFTAAVRPSDYENAYLVAQSFETGERKLIYEHGYHGRYLPSGHLVFVHQGTLFAVPFDGKRLEMKGTPAPVLEGLLASTGNAGAQFSFSDTGMLVYLTGAQSSAVAGVWANRRGTTTPLLETPGDYYDPRFSPDGKHIALRIGGIATGDIWVYEIARGTATRLSFNPGLDILPLWSPDGQWVTYTSGARLGSIRIVRKRADGVGDEEVLYESKGRAGPMAWSPDGKLLVIIEESPQTSFDIKTLRLDADGPGKHKVEPFLATPFVEHWPDLSPDGRWLAYRSNESGRFEVYVRPFPGPGGKWQVSTEGGDFPRWSPKSNELFYLAPDGKSVMAVSYSAVGGAFRPEKPRLLFQADFADRSPFRPYDVAPDGQRFLILKRLEGKPTVQQPTLVLNWFEELRRQLAPARSR